MKTTSNINVSILGSKGTIYHVANTRLYNQNRKCHVLEVGFPSVNRGKGSSSPNSRRSSPCLRNRTHRPLDRQGRSTWSGLKYLNNAFPRPIRRKLVISRPNYRPQNDRYNLGASLSIIHISKTSGLAK